VWWGLSNEYLRSCFFFELKFELKYGTGDNRGPYDDWR
jgi:hypothetical protein